MRFLMSTKENRTNKDFCPYCLGFKKVSMHKPIVTIGKYRLVKEIQEPCAYCTLIKISKSEIDFLRKKNN